MEWFWYICYVAVLIGLAGYGVHRLTIVYLYLRYGDQEPQPPKQWDELPVVTVQLPMFNELHVAERLLECVAKLDYPKDKLHIQVLDDSTDETIQIASAAVDKLKAQGFDADYVHRTDRTGFKAGALENGTVSAKGEYLLILDADFLPNPDLLQKTIQHFTDPEIALVQTRWGHLNRTYNTLTRVQAMFLDGHMELEQTARNRGGRFFTFNGTAGIWRKEAITDAGGWHHDTLTEDMDLSYRAQLKGWKFIFLNKVETPAELPVDMDGFKNQQHRWTKGSIQCCKKGLANIWRADIPLTTKLEATAHLTSNFAYLLLIALCFIIPNKTQPEALGDVAPWLINIPIFLFASGSVILFYLIAQKSLRPDSWMKEIKYLPLLLALGIGMSINNARAVLEAIFNQESAFVRTPKYGINKTKKTSSWKKSRYKALKSLNPFIELAFGVFFAIFVIKSFIEGSFIGGMLMLPFPVGFFYTSFSSIAQMLPSKPVAAEQEDSQ